MCRYTALRNISLQKWHRPKAQQRQPRRVLTEDFDRGRRADSKPVRPATNSSFNTLNNTIWCRANYFFTAILV